MKGDKNRMEQSLYENHLAILKEELLVALGCTEPIAIAYAGAKARKLLGQMPQDCQVYCSGNIIKNVKGVIVPNSGGMRGMDVAATLGIVGGDPEQELAVLESVTDQDIQHTQALLKAGFCQCHLVEDVDNLYVRVEVKGGGHSAVVEIQEHHNHITYLEKDGEVIFDGRPGPKSDQENTGPDRMLLNMKNILEFAEAVKLDDVREILQRQIDYNCAISAEGLKGNYGVETGRILMSNAINATGRNRVLSASRHQLRKRQPGHYRHHANRDVRPTLGGRSAAALSGAGDRQSDQRSPKKVYRKPERLLRRYQRGHRRGLRRGLHAA